MKCNADKNWQNYGMENLTGKLVFEKSGILINIVVHKCDTGSLFVF